MKETNTNTHVSTKTQNATKAKCIKLGIDVHADSYRVVRQIDHATPQPAQKFTPKDFLVWAKKQLDQAEAVHSCYEAGPLGYSLHRALIEMGIDNVVIRPQNWDELHKGVKTDKTGRLRELSGTVVVVGAGNTAIDAANAARRLGAETVYLLYRRGERDMSAFDFEYEHAKQEGVQFLWRRQPFAIRANERGRPGGRPMRSCCRVSAKALVSRSSRPWRVVYLV